jgi:hypothetical protein
MAGKQQVEEREKRKRKIEEKREMRQLHLFR